MKVIVTSVISMNALGESRLTGATLKVIPEDVKDEIIEDWLKQHKQTIIIDIAENRYSLKKEGQNEQSR